MATTATPSLSFTEALNNSTNKVLQFRGRSRRSEYWWTMLVVYLVYLFIPFLGILLGIATIPLTFRRLHDTGRSGWWWGVNALLQLAFSLTLLYDVVMISTEMIGDDILSLMHFFIVKYAVWLLILFIYRIILFIFLCIDSEKGDNKYGESPKYVESNPSEEVNA